MSHSIVSLDSFKEVMIYGYSSTRADAVKVLAHEKVAQVYNYDTPCKSVATLSGRSFIPLPYSPSIVPTLCKNTLVAVVIENYLRKQEGFPLIPVIFCLESTEYGPFPAAEIANKKLDWSPELGKISKSEIRRMYKLCADPSLSSEVKEVARETFKFVHVRTLSLELEEREAPWEKEAEVWTEAWNLKKTGKSKAAPSKLNWRKLLVDPAKAHEMIDSSKQSVTCCIQ